MGFVSMIESVRVPKPHAEAICLAKGSQWCYLPTHGEPQLLCPCKPQQVLPQTFSAWNQCIYTISSSRWFHSATIAAMTILSLSLSPFDVSSEALFSDCQDLFFSKCFCKKLKMLSEGKWKRCTHSAVNQTRYQPPNSSECF